PFGRSLEERQKIAFQSQHQDLAFRVAEADIVFQEFRRAVLADHQARKEHAMKGSAFGSHALYGWQHDLPHHPLFQRFGHEGSGGEGAHASGVWSMIAVEDALVVLRARKWQGGL